MAAVRRRSARCIRADPWLRFPQKRAMRDEYQGDPLARLEARLREVRAMTARTRVRLDQTYEALQRTHRIVAQSRSRAEETRDLTRKLQA